MTERGKGKVTGDSCNKNPALEVYIYKNNGDRSTAIVVHRSPSTLEATHMESAGRCLVLTEGSVLE